MKYTQHIVGELIGGIQTCVICGAVITDYRGTMVPDGTPPLRGFPAGPVYIRGVNPIETTIYISDNDEFDVCKS